METQNIHYFEKVEAPKHRDYINLQNHCVLCNTALEFTHTNQEELDQGPTLKEEAFCPQCNVKVRAKIYSLQ